MGRLLTKETTEVYPSLCGKYYQSPLSLRGVTCTLEDMPPFTEKIFWSHKWRKKTHNHSRHFGLRNSLISLLTSSLCLQNFTITLNWFLQLSMRVCLHMAFGEYSECQCFCSSLNPHLAILDIQGAFHDAMICFMKNKDDAPCVLYLTWKLHAYMLSY